MADTIGLRAGLYMDSPDLIADDRQFFLTPQLEYEHSFGKFDVYGKGQYTFSLTGLYPQFFFAEEWFAFHLPLTSLSEFRIGLHNENELRIKPDQNGGGGRVKPEAGYALFLPPGDISLALGLPLAYPLGGWGTTGDTRDTRFGLEMTAAYVTPLWLGFEAVANLIAAPVTSFDSIKFALNYTGDQFYGELAFRGKESFSYFSLKAEFNYFFDFLILWGALEAGDLANPDALTLGAAAGIKYRF
ncbi:MAG: hypothetical protein LBD78_07805 [Spirochaetaceae bacterium]|nr:hypothetical protein [Spirochaetaceae bacterium]